MAKKISFSDVGAPRPDRLTADLKAMEDGHRDAMQGLCCVQGRLRSIPSRDAVAALSHVVAEWDSDAQRHLPAAMRRAHHLHQKVTAVLDTVDAIVEEWVREDIYEQIAHEEAVKKSTEEDMIMAESEIDDRVEH